MESRTRRVVATIVGLAAIALLAGACTQDPERVALPGLGDPVAATPAADDQLTPDRSPMTIDRTDVDAGIEAFVPLAETALADTGVPGMAVGVVYDDELVWAEGFGVRKLDEDGAAVDDGPAGRDGSVEEDTVFQLASMSKPVGSTVVAGLVGQGHLDWDDPVRSHAPDFALADPWVSEHVTVADLYSHRSGLPDHAGDSLEDLGFGRDEILARLRLLPLDDFRSNYAYTNFGLTKGALAAATAAGGEWEDLSESVLYEPLGMTSTSSRFADYESAPTRAWTHMRDADGTWTTGEERRPDAQTPAGGVSSSVKDLSQWLRLQLGNGTVDGTEVVDGAALDRTHTPHGLSGAPNSPESRIGSYGLGFNINTDEHGRQRWNHSGAFLLGAGTNVTMVPAERLGVVVLTNGTPIGLAESMTETLLDLILEGDVSRDWLGLYGPMFEQMIDPPVEVDYSAPPADPVAPRVLSDYAGTYDNEFHGPAVVSVDGDALLLTMGPGGAVRQRLEHFDGDTFSLLPWGESGTTRSSVEFGAGADVATLRIDYLDEHGLGTFSRTG